MKRLIIPALIVLGAALLSTLIVRQEALLQANNKLSGDVTDLRMTVSKQQELLAEVKANVDTLATLHPWKKFSR